LIQVTDHLAIRPVLPLAWCALVAVVLVATVVWNLRRRRLPVSRGRLVCLTVLRAAVVLAVVLLLLRPEIVWESQKEVPGEIAFLIDASRSMTIPDALDADKKPVTRAAAVRAAFLAGAESYMNLTKRFSIRSFAFGAGLRPVADFAPAPADARTDPGEALSALASQAGRRLVAAVLVGDGAANRNAVRAANVSLPSPHPPPSLATSTARPLTRAARNAAHLAETGVRVHTVAAGSPEPSERVRDVAVGDLRAPERVFVGGRPAVRARLTALGMKGRPVNLALKVNGEVAEQQTLTPTSHQMVREVVFTPTLKEPGVVRIALEAEPVEGELAEINNASETAIRVEKGSIRVLYLEGHLRPEAKFIARALGGGDEISLDRRILVGPDASAATPSADDLNAFDVTVLGDLLAGALPSPLLDRLAARVKEGNLALVVLGGLNAFGAGGWADTPVADLLPVAIRPEDGQVGGPIRFIPTAAGRRHFILKPEEEGDDPFDELPALSGASGVGGVRPTAQVLAASEEGRPMLAVCEVGRGRTAALTVDTTYTWVLSADDPQGSERHRRFWRQLILWAAGRDEKPEGDLVIVTDRVQYFLSESDNPPAVEVTVYMEAGDEKAAAPTARLTEPDGTVRNIPLAAERDGQWRATLRPGVPGSYRLEAEAEVSGTGRRAETEFILAEPDFEMASPLADHEALRQIAEAGGGTFRTLDDLAGLFEELAQDIEPVYEAVPHRLPIASGRIFLGVVIALLSADWFLRRRWRLA